MNTRFLLRQTMGLIASTMFALPSMAQWQVQTVFEPNLRAVDFADAVTGWAVGDSGAILKTTDAGLSWTRQISGTTNRLTKVDATTPTTCYAASDSGSVIQRTTNGGASWQSVSWSLSDFINDFAFYNANLGLALTNWGVERTLDGGLTWIETPFYMNSELGQLQWVSAAIAVMADRNGKVWRSLDSGTTWTSFPASSGVKPTAVSFTDSLTGTVIGKTTEQYPKDRLMRTTNGGASWSTKIEIGSCGFPGAQLLEVQYGNPLRGVTIGKIEQSGCDGGTLRFIQYTSDGGNTWQNATVQPAQGIATSWFRGIAFADSLTAVAVGDQNTIIRTTNGGAAWTVMSGRTSTAYTLRDVQFTSATHGFAVGGDEVRIVSAFVNYLYPQGIVRQTTDGGATWQQLETGLLFNDIHAVDSLTAVAVGYRNYGIAFTGANAGAVYRTTNGGSSWTRQLGEFTPFTPLLFGVHFLTAQRGFAVGNEASIYRTTNGGTTWTSQTVGTPGQRLNRITFISDSVGVVVGAGVILRTSNGGDTWTPVSSSIVPQLYALTFSDAVTGWAVGDSGMILKTIDAGQTWSVQPSGITDGLIGIDFGNPSVGIAVGVGGKILRTTNGGTTWTPENSGTTQALYAIHISPNQSWTVGGGGTTLKAAGVSRSEREGELIKTYSLSQNYPNPFNPSTTIRFTMKTAGTATVKVFDVLGRAVRTQLLNAVAGDNEYRFDGTGLGSGLYFYRLEVGASGSQVKGFSETRKMLLIK